MYDQDDSAQLVAAVEEMLVEHEPPESFCPWSIRMPIDEETLPMILKVGFKPRIDFK